MARKKIMFGVGAGIVSLGVDGLTSLLVLRLLTRYLSPETAGFWVLVTSAGSLLLILQCGMGPTVARAVAGACAGNDTPKLESTIVAVYIAFRYICSAVILVSIVIYFAYLWPTARKAGIPFHSALGWFTYALGMAANLAGQANLFILDGCGEVGWDKVFRAILTSIGFIAVWVALFFGANLLTLGLIYLFQNLLFWYFATRKLHSFMGDSVSLLRPEYSQVIGLFFEGSKLLLLNLATYLITQFTVFVVESNFGLKQVTSYTAMLRVGMLIAAVGSLLPQMMYPYVAKSGAARDYKKSQRYYMAGLLVAVGTAVILSTPIFLLGRDIFRIWLGSSLPYSAPCFLAVLTFYVIFVNHGANATPALAIGGNAFTIPAIVNTAMVLLLVFILPKYWGIVGIPLGMILGTIPSSVYVIWKAWHIIMRPKPVGL